MARASLAELANDYLNWLLRLESIPWSQKSAEFIAVNGVRLDTPVYKDDVLHQSSMHILAQKHKFDTWLATGDAIVAANCLLVLCNRLILMISFTEGLTAERLSFRTQQSVEANAPLCPLCGKPMVKRVAKKGIHSGREFWSCSAYPACNGTRNV